MYTYKLYVVVIYLLSFRWYVCASDPVEATPKTNITFDLRNLKEFEHVNENPTRYEVKHTTFTTPTDKVVEKVVYDTVNVWVASEHTGKTLKQLVVTEKRNLLQLVDVVLVNSSGDQTEEHKYYKKQKKQFTVVQAEEYNKLKGFVAGKLDRYSDLWFLYDFGNKDSYSKFVGQKNYLLDGVWKTTFAPYPGKALLLRDGTQVLWTHANDDKHLTSVDLFEFDADKLLVLNFGDVEAKYFHKPKTAATEWKTLDSETVFNTKANEFKTKYFTTALEHDLAKKPDYNKFWVNRTLVYGNVSELNMNPTRTYLFNKVRFGDQVLWSSDKKENRVYAMKLTLLGYEVKTVQLVVTKDAMKLDPNYDVLYYHKDASNTFQTKNKEEYKVAVSSVKAAADRVRAFTYVDTWLQKGSRLDVASYNKEEFTVETAEGTEGVVTETLTPKDNMWFASVGFGAVDVWPATGVEVNNPSVKKVVLVKKNSLLQLVHLTVSGTSTAAHSDATEVEHYFKKNGDAFDTVDTLTSFNAEKAKLDVKGQLLDPYVHLDVNTELAEPYYTVATETVDGVDKKVVTVNTLKVTKLTNFATELWTKPPEPQDAHVKGFEVYSVADKKLLKVLVNQGTPDANTTFEKTGENTQWTPLTENFNAKLLAFKAPQNWTSVELDVGVSPSLTDFDVVVTALKGNRTKLVLTPKKMKKVTKVKLGNNKEFFATADSNRAYKVELYLETYAAKFVKVFVWKDVATSNEQQLTDVKQFKDGDNWVSDNFDTKLEAFLAEENTVPFTYSEKWVQPPTTFDPKAFSATYFGTEDATADLVKTTTYTPRPGTAVNKVSLYGDKVWPEGDAPDATKKLVELKVLSKNDMVQLVHLKNVLVATPATMEDLYYKKETDRYVKLDLENFDKLKATLSQAETYVDDKVKLDLSATEEASTKLFEKETTLEDGVEKTVVVVKAGKLFEVSASPPLWKSEDGSYVTKLERYALDAMQLLVLHITKQDATKETKYFEKPLSPPAVATEPAADPSRPEVPRPEVPAPQLPQERAQPESQLQEQVQQETLLPTTPAKPSFEPLNDKAAFFAKLNTAKATVQHQDVSLDVKAYNEPAKYEVREAREGNATLFKVYPKKPYRVTGLVNGAGNKLWTDPVEGERLVEAFFYVHEQKVKFVRAVVWAKDHTDESKDKLLHFKLENETFVTKEADAFATEVRELTMVALTPLATETVVQPDPTPLSFRKFYLSDQVDANVFELRERKKGAYKLKNYKPKQDMFVNVVETQHGVLWKASNVGDYMKSTFFAVTENSALAHLTVLVNSLPNHLFFKFENERWATLDSNAYVDLYAKAGLSSASS